MTYLVLLAFVAIIGSLGAALYYMLMVNQLELQVLDAGGVVGIVLRHSLIP